MTSNLLLPAGWFTDADIEYYQDIYERRVSVGGTTAEIGLYLGRSLMSVSEIIRRKNITVICVDDWSRYGGDPTLDRLQAFRKAAEAFGILEQCRIANVRSPRAAEFVPDASLDFVFIDANHSYEAVKADIEGWEPKIKKGGWIGGHDYNSRTDPGVPEAVNEKYPKTRLRLHPDTTIWLVQL